MFLCSHATYPPFIQTASKSKTRQLLLENLNEEEKGKENHPELWMRFAEGMGNSRNDVNETIPIKGKLRN